MKYYRLKKTRRNIAGEEIVGSPSAFPTFL